MQKKMFIVLSLIATFVVCITTYSKTPQNEEQNDEKRTDIQFDDLKERYRIIGQLGKPVGKYYTIRGTWEKYSFSSQSLFFHVTHVDNQRLSETLIYPERQFSAYSPFDLKLDIESIKSLVCEYRVFESLYFSSTPQNFWKEAKITPIYSINSYENRRAEKELNFELTSMLVYHAKPRLIQQAADPQEKVEKTSIEFQNQNRINIDFYDLRDRYRIIGKLGKSLGEYSTIRGVWKIEKSKNNHRKWVRLFNVTHIDGREIKNNIVYDEWGGISSLNPYAFDPPLPIPEKSDTWEFRVVESMDHFGMPKNYQKKILSQPNPGIFELNSILRYHNRPKITRDVKSN